MRSIVSFLLFNAVSILAKAKEADAPPANPVVDYVQNLVTPVGNAAMSLASDGVALVVAAPGFGVDVFVWAVGHLRRFPDLVKNVYNGDSGTIDGMLDFCVYAAGTIFAVYAALTAINLALGLAVAVKDYFESYMVIPTAVLGQKLPGPVLQARNIIQKEVLDRIRSFRVGAWIVPLEGQSGKPSLAAATPVLASAASACMILSCAPAIHALMKNGADKGAAEALLYTMGTALGVQYLVKKVA